MPLNAEDAFDLSKQFRDLGINLGNYRFANWNTLTPTQRRDLEDEEWSLLNASSDMTTKAVGLALEESEINVQNITSSVGKAKRAIKKLEKVGEVLKSPLPRSDLPQPSWPKILAPLRKTPNSSFKLPTCSRPLLPTSFLHHTTGPLSIASDYSRAAVKTLENRDASRQVPRPKTRDHPLAREP